MIGKGTDTENTAAYNYRYFLPYAPEWGTPEHCNRRLQELLEFCQAAKVDAVQFYVNTLPGTYYMPAHSAAEQIHWAAWMKDKVAPALREIGVSYQLNYQMLLGAHSGGLDMRDEYGWGFLVNENGEETLGCGCPIDPDFRRIMGDMLRLWAGTGPDIIWIDDDFRMHNHGKGTNGCDFYCYCPTHLKLFSQQLGRKITRKELVAEVLQPGAPSPLRNQWLDFTGATMTESAAWIRQEVQGVSPKTRLAQMTSAPDVHSVEGRDWKTFLSALCGKYRPITRPCSGVYTGTAVPPRQQVTTYRFMAQSMAMVEQAFGAGVAEYGPELENTRFTTWCKSVRNSEYVMMLGQLLGCPEITLSLNDLDGSPISEEPTTVPLLRDNKPRLQALAELGLRHWQRQGVAFINDPNAARKVQLPAGVAPKMQDLGLLRHWEDVLLQMGIPAFYAAPQQAADDKAVVILEGYTAWCPSDPEMERILAGSVLLDGAAALVLQQRGFNRLIGVKVGEHRSYSSHAEVFHGDILAGLETIRVPNRNRDWYELEPDGAMVVSRLIDPKNCYHTGSTIFENERGGRVAIHAGVGDTEGTLASHARRRWLHGVLRWLSKEQFCALPIVPHHGLTVVQTERNRLLLAFANLGTDPLFELKVRLPRAVAGLKVLDRSGQWRPTPLVRGADAAELTIPCHLEVFDWQIALFE